MRDPRGITLLELLVIVALVCLFAALIPFDGPGIHRGAKKRDCINNLRQLGVYLVMYESKYGGDSSYPPAAGKGFWQTLRTVPSGQPLVREDGLFACKVLGTVPSPVACDYTAPVDPLVDGMTPAQRPIASDRTTNHDVGGNGDINVLLFNGSVVTCEPDSNGWKSANIWTR